jgi:hypothetical protein
MGISRVTEIPMSADKRLKNEIVEFFSMHRNIQRYRDSWKNIGTKKHSKFLNFISYPVNWAKTLGYVYIIIIILCIAINVIYFHNTTISAEVSIGQLIVLLISIEFWVNQSKEKFISQIWKPPLSLSGLLEHFVVGRRKMPVSSGLLANIIFILTSPWYVDIALSRLGFGFTWVIMFVFILIGNFLLYIPVLNIRFASTVDWKPFLKQPIPTDYDVTMDTFDGPVNFTELPDVPIRIRDKKDRDIISEYLNK